MSPAQLAKAIEQGESTALARGITLVESQRPADWVQAKELLSLLSHSTNQSYRLGFSGPPGVGKSSFIEKLGLEFVASNKKVAVLAIDPSSELTGGSILGDKTRMEELSRHSLSFIRPSASRGHLGGVTSRLPGVILLCEAAGFEWILVESVGVGQSEVEISRMVDFFTLVAQPGAGDELQGIKKGILEYVDAIVVNKADRNPELINTTMQQYLSALKIVRAQAVPVYKCSALTGEGIKELHNFYSELPKSIKSQQKEYEVFWYESLVLSEFKNLLSQVGPVKKSFEKNRQAVEQKRKDAVEAVEQFFKDLKLMD